MIIEDEQKIARVIQLELEHEGYRARHAADGIAGMALATNEPWDLIILDILLPGKNGLEVLAEIRRRDAMVPVLLLTALSTVQDKVAGLDLGANDYIAKPFSMEELLARVRGLLRVTSLVKEQARAEPEEVLTAGDLTVNVAAKTVVRRGKSIELTPREFDLLLFLLRNKNKVLSREQILSEVWGYDFIGDTNLVDVYIRYLRKKVEKGFGNPLIRTRRGLGYCLVEPKR